MSGYNALLGLLAIATGSDRSHHLWAPGSGEWESGVVMSHRD